MTYSYVYSDAVNGSFLKCVLILAYLGPFSKFVVVAVLPLLFFPSAQCNFSLESALCSHSPNSIPYSHLNGAVSLTTWSAWPHGQAGHMVRLATWSVWSHGQAGHMVRLATWSGWPHGQADHIVRLATWSGWLHGRSDHIVRLATWSVWPHGQTDCAGL